VFRRGRLSTERSALLLPSSLYARKLSGAHAGPSGAAIDDKQTGSAPPGNGRFPGKVKPRRVVSLTHFPKTGCGRLGRTRTIRKIPHTPWTGNVDERGTLRLVRAGPSSEGRRKRTERNSARTRRSVGTFSGRARRDDIARISRYTKIRERDVTFGFPNGA